MRADRPGGDVEVLTDLAIGHAASRQRRDLTFLRRQAVSCVGSGATAGFAGRAQFLPRSLRPWACAERVNAIARLSERAAGFGVAPLSPQPDAVGEQQA